MDGIIPKAAESRVHKCHFMDKTCAHCATLVYRWDIFLSFRILLLMAGIFFGLICPMSHDDSISEKKENFFQKNEKLLTRRRKFIREKLHAEGKVPEEAIRAWLEKEGKGQSSDEGKRQQFLKLIKRDIDFINTYEGRSIFRQQNTQTRDWEWVDDSRKLGTTRGERLRYNETPKMQIAELLSSLVLGFDRIKVLQAGEKPPVFIQHLARIKKALKFSKDGEKRTELQNKLEAFWLDGDRRLFLDSGTTTEIFADKFLSYFRMPMNGIDPKNEDELSDEQPVNKIEVVTNDRHIFFLLGEPEVNIKTIVVGGRQQFKTSAISGMMAERFLESNDIRAGMAIVGTTAVAVNKNSRPHQTSHFYAENDHVASIKRSLLKRAKIKIIIADSSKFHSQGEHADTRICSLSKEEIDLVITDKIFDDDEKERQKTIQHFQQYKVPILDFDTIADARM